MILVRTERGTHLLKELLGAGRQGGFWAHPEHQDLGIKVYDAPQELELRRLVAMLDRPPQPEREGKTPAYAWPLEAVSDPNTGQVIGFIMPRCEAAVPLEHVSNPALRIPAIQAGWLFQVARSLAMRVYGLHWCGYVWGDLQPNNVLVNRHGVVTAIDMDSLQFTSASGEFFPALYGMPEFQAPEFSNCEFARVQRTPASDVYSLAILIHMLVRGAHPFECHYLGKGTRPNRLARMRAGQWPDSGRHKEYAAPRGVPAFASLPVELRELFRRTFEDGHHRPEQRPTATEFIVGLDKVMRAQP